MSTDHEHPALMEIVDRARLTPSSVVETESRRVSSGGVYADGHLVRRAQWRSRPARVFIDPETIDVANEPARRLAGTWLYGGTWMGHFGHFLIETLSGLWPDPDPEIVGVIFHRGATTMVQTWQRDLVARAGWRVPLEHVGSEPGDTEVERLVVPQPGLEIGRRALGAVRELWDRMTMDEPVVGPLFLSRSGIGGQAVERTFEDDEQVEARLAEQGFRTVRPEVLTIEEQLRTVASASALVGFEGTKLHLAAFTRPNTPVVSIGSRREYAAAHRNQTLISVLKGQPLDVVPTIAERNARDVDRTVSAVMHALGRSNRAPTPSRPARHDWVSIERWPLLLRARLGERINQPAAVLQVGTPTGQATPPWLTGVDRSFLDHAAGGSYTIVHLLQPGLLRERYRDVLGGLRALEPGGAVLLGHLLPSNPGLNKDHAGWRVLEVIERLHPELDYRTVLGGWAAQTLIWPRESGPSMDLGASSEFAEIEASNWFEVPGRGIPPWLRPSNLDEAYDAWRRSPGSLGPASGSNTPRRRP